MMIVLGRPIAWLMDQLTDGLNSMQGGSADPPRRDPRPDDGVRHGRPAQQGRPTPSPPPVSVAPPLADDAPELKIMAAVMLAGMVPPIALALATVLRPGLFNVPERENGKAGWLLGAVLHHRGRHPVRRGRPAARDPRDHGRAAPSPAGLSMAHGRRACGPRTAGSSCCSPSTNVLGFLIALVAGVARGRRARHRPEEPSARPTPTSPPSDQPAPDCTHQP